MGSKTKFMEAGVSLLGVVVIAAGIGFLVGRRDSNELTELPAFEGQAEVTDGAAAVVPEPLPAGDASARGPQSDSSGPGWRTNEVRINQEQALGIARTRFEDARLLHAELDEEDGYFLWEVLLQRADGSYVEVLIDAGDSRILGVDQEGFDD